MSVRTNGDHEDAHREGEIELVTAVVTYEGDRSMYASENLRSAGGYPARGGFQRGVSQIVRLPSEKLGWWENHSDFDIDYSEAAIARALLESNYLPEDLTGPGYDPALRENLLEKFGMENVPGTPGGWREELRGVAGVGEDEDDAPDEPDRLVEDLQQNDRGVLLKVANSYDDIEGFIEGREEEQVTHLPQTALAEFLAEKDEREVRQKLDQAEMGNDVD